MNVFICVCIYDCMYECLVCNYVCMYACMHVCMYVSIHLSMYNACMYPYIYVCVYVPYCMLLILGERPFMCRSTNNFVIYVYVCSLVYEPITDLLKTK